MVFAIQCPNPKCKKFMLVEDKDRDSTVTCLICKTSIRLGGGPAQAPAGDRPPVRKPKP